MFYVKSINLIVVFIIVFVRFSYGCSECENKNVTVEDSKSYQLVDDFNFM